MNYLVLAMKRSGHHVFMNWIAAHTGQVIYNNVCFGWDKKELRTMRGNKLVNNGITNIEDFNPAMWDCCDFPSFPFVKKAKIILFMRDPGNWLASCYKRKGSSNKERRDVYDFLDKRYINDSKMTSPSRIELYKAQRDWCPIGSAFVSLYEFLRNKTLREMLADYLEFKFSEKADEVIKKPSEYGGGSSFGETKTTVFNREEEYKDDPEFNRLLKKLKEK